MIDVQLGFVDCRNDFFSVVESFLPLASQLFVDFGEIEVSWVVFRVRA
jgi:hypothetical protein